MIQPTSLGLRAHHQPDKPAQPPRDSISPLLKSPVLVNQCCAKDRRLTCFEFHPLRAVLQLGFGFSPGSWHQLQKLRNCQRTSICLRLLFLESRKSVRLYPLCFQSSAARPQPHDRIWCSPAADWITENRLTGAFGCHNRGQAHPNPPAIPSMPCE
jgi:hypothetical protein